MHQVLRGAGIRNGRQLRPRFLREVAAYIRFRELGAPHVPRLVSCDLREMVLVTERVLGPTLKEVLESGADVHQSPIIDQLLSVDRFLWERHIDAQFPDLKDVILEEATGRIFLIDFEFTAVDRPYTSFLLLDLASSRKLERMETSRAASEFRKLALRRSRHARAYWLRKASNPFLRRVFSRSLVQSKILKDLATGAHHGREH